MDWNPVYFETRSESSPTKSSLCPLFEPRFSCLILFGSVTAPKHLRLNVFCVVFEVRSKLGLVLVISLYISHLGETHLPGFGKTKSANYIKRVASLRPLWNRIGQWVKFDFHWLRNGSGFYPAPDL